MISSRFYRPRMASLTDKEQALLGSFADSGITYLEPEDFKTRYTVQGDYVDAVEGGCQITYSFPYYARDNKFVMLNGKKGSYGAKGMTYRMLYEMLCQLYNGGEYFIDTYFERIFRSRAEHDKLMTLNADIEDAIIVEEMELRNDLHFKKDGTPDMRFTTSKNYRNYKVWQEPIKKAMAERLSIEIKEDIVRCLRTGMIPLSTRQTVSAKTMETRARFPALSGNKMFYASGRLIEHLSLFVEVGGR